MLESTVWEATVLGHRFQSGGLQSRATDFGSRGPLTGLGAYSLGAYSLGPPLGPPILDLGDHSPIRKKQYRGPFNVNVVQGKVRKMNLFTLLAKNTNLV